MEPCNEHLHQVPRNEAVLQQALATRGPRIHSDDQQMMRLQHCLQGHCIHADDASDEHSPDNQVGSWEHSAFCKQWNAWDPGSSAFCVLWDGLDEWDPGST
eukprot:473656-Pelagomonas_calceolata.AAC.1